MFAAPSRVRGSVDNTPPRFHSLKSQGDLSATAATVDAALQKQAASTVFVSTPILLFPSSFCSAPLLLPLPGSQEIPLGFSALSWDFSRTPFTYMHKTYKGHSFWRRPSSPFPCRTINKTKRDSWVNHFPFVGSKKGSSRKRLFQEKEVKQKLPLFSSRHSFIIGSEQREEEKSRAVAVPPDGGRKEERKKGRETKKKAAK